MATKKNGLISMSAAAVSEGLVGSKVDERMIVVDLSALPVEPSEGRHPVKLVVCLDLSEAMEGDRLDRVKEGLLAIANSLSEDDALGVVGFSRSSWVVAPMMSCDRLGKQVLRHLIPMIRTYGQSNIVAGLEQARAMLAGVRLPHCSDRILLVTSGSPDAEVVSERILGFVADDLPYAREEMTIRPHLSVLCLGEEGPVKKREAYLMRAMASRGGGRFSYAKRSENIVEMMGVEMGAILTTAASSVRIKFVPGKGCAMKTISEEILADVSGGSKRTIVFRVKVRHDFREATIGHLEISWLNAQGYSVFETMKVPCSNEREPPHVASDVDLAEGVLGGESYSGDAEYEIMSAAIGLLEDRDVGSSTGRARRTPCVQAVVDAVLREVEEKRGAALT